MKKWLIGGLIGFILALLWIIYNFIKVLDNGNETHIILLFFIILIIGIFKSIPIIVSGASIGFAIENKKYTLPFGIIGLSISLFFMEHIGRFLFVEMINLEESSISGTPALEILIPILGFGVGALIGFFYNKVKYKKQEQPKEQTTP
jgi:hypothetical protein